MKRIQRCSNRIGLKAGAKIAEKEFERGAAVLRTGMGIHIAASNAPGVHAGVVEKRAGCAAGDYRNGVNALRHGGVL